MELAWIPLPGHRATRAGPSQIKQIPKYPERSHIPQQGTHGSYRIGSVGKLDIREALLTNRKSWRENAEGSTNTKLITLPENHTGRFRNDPEIRYVDSFTLFFRIDRRYCDWVVIQAAEKFDLPYLRDGPANGFPIRSIADFFVPRQ